MQQTVAAVVCKSLPQLSGGLACRASLPLSEYKDVGSAGQSLLISWDPGCALQQGMRCTVRDAAAEITVCTHNVLASFTSLFALQVNSSFVLPAGGQCQPGLRISEQVPSALLLQLEQCS